MKYDSYEIFSGSQKVAIWENGKLTVYNESLLPMYLKRIANADMWLETRAIDSHRANSRLLKKALRLTEKNRRHRKSRILITHQNKKQAQACFLSE